MRRGRAKVPLSLARAALALPGSQPSRMPLRHARENGAFERLWLSTSGREARADQALSCLHGLSSSRRRAIFAVVAESADVAAGPLSGFKKGSLGRPVAAVDRALPSIVPPLPRHRVEALCGMMIQ